MELITNVDKSIVDSEFDRIVTKFRIRNDELGDIYIAWRKGVVRHPLSRMEGYIGLVVRNLRIDKFKARMKELSRWSAADETGFQTNEYWTVEKKVLFNERVEAFRTQCPEMKDVLDAWVSGRNVSDMLLNRLTKKFQEIPV